MSRKKKIGFWMKDGKAKRINVSKIRDILMAKYQTELVNMNIVCKDDLPVVDVMFHKMADLIFGAQQGKSADIHELNRFLKYFNTHTNMRVFDPLPNIKVVLDRVSMMEAIQKCSKSCPSDQRFYSCGYHLVEETDISALSGSLTSKDFFYPMICKSRIAQGAQGHEMSIIFNEAGLREAKMNSVVVPFIDHGSVLYKVFVCGDKFHVAPRPSINLGKLQTQSNQLDVYNFDSDTVSKVSEVSTSRVQEDLCGLSTPSDMVPLPDEYRALIPHWVKVMREVLNLSLFGFDVLFESKTDKPFVIDVNYFPGYDGFDDFHEVLADMLHQATL